MISITVDSRICLVQHVRIVGTNVGASVCGRTRVDTTSGVGAISRCGVIAVIEVRIKPRVSLVHSVAVVATIVAGVWVVSVSGLRIRVCGMCVVILVTRKSVLGLVDESRHDDLFCIVCMERLSCFKKVIAFRLFLTFEF